MARDDKTYFSILRTISWSRYLSKTDFIFCKYFCFIISFGFLKASCALICGSLQIHGVEHTDVLITCENMWNDHTSGDLCVCVFWLSFKLSTSAMNHQKRLCHNLFIISHLISFCLSWSVKNIRDTCKYIDIYLYIDTLLIIFDIICYVYLKTCTKTDRLELEE